MTHAVPHALPIAAMAFGIAATSLVIELGVTLAGSMEGQAAMDMSVAHQGLRARPQ